MKQLIIKPLVLAIIVAFAFGSCQNDLLDQPDKVNLPAFYYWKTESDALSALHGVYGDIRYLFDKDYYLEGQSDFVRSRGQTFGSKLSQGGAYRGLYETRPISYGSGYEKMFEACYGVINRANYAIDGITHMISNTTNEKTVKTLEQYKAEALVMRSLCYFRLISMWGDVPYIGKTVYSNDEVQYLSRMPLAQLKDSLVNDLSKAAVVLPQTNEGGRISQPAAIALRGKVQLYWASWNDFGWPELDTFTPNKEEAQKAYEAAAKDFWTVISEYGITLYKNGEPGDCDEPGRFINVGKKAADGTRLEKDTVIYGKADKLPNYHHLFTSKANGDPEFILAFNHGGVGTAQGEEIMRDLAGRNFENSQCWVSPRFEIADRYQSVITGDFCDPLIKISLGSDDAQVLAARTTKNSALNPQSYAGRDYRMKSTIIWDYELSMGIYSKKETGWVPFIYKNWGVSLDVCDLADGKYEYNNYTTYNTDGTNSGYVFRKFIRNYPVGNRSEGDFNWPVIRLADVYLMYAEAVCMSGSPGSAEWQNAVDFVDKVRYRGNLPKLTADKTANKDSFFKAIEQERIVELIGEGQRPFDVRRWRKIEELWGPHNGQGKVLYDTWGSVAAEYYVNQSSRAYEQCYIFAIPYGERDKNPNLTQNKPFR